MRRACPGRAVAGLAACALLALLSACAGAPGARERPVQLQERQLIVALPLVTPDLRAELGRRIAGQYDLELVGAFPLRSVDIHCVVFEVPAGRDLAAVARALRALPGVSLVQRNQVFQSMTAEDPYAELQHGPARIGADRAHRWATGRGIRVGVIDTGVDAGHPDLAGRVVERGNFVQDGEASFEQDAHGTAVAGIIAAVAGNAVGIYGVAPDAELVVAKACWHPAAEGGALCSSWTLARAIDFALRSDVRVLNLSLAGPEDRLLTALLRRAAAADVAVAAAAGDGPELAFPASLAFVVAVRSAETASPSVAVGADGPLLAPGREILTTAPGAAYRFQDGSSLSTAHVTGAMALLLELQPALSPAELGDLLARSSSEAGAAPGIDACAAIRHLSGGVSCPGPPASSSGAAD